MLFEKLRIREKERVVGGCEFFGGKEAYRCILRLVIKVKKDWMELMVYGFWFKSMRVRLEIRLW